MMGFLLNLLLFLPLFSLGSILVFLTFYFAYLGLHGLMGWLLHLSTMGDPQSPWTFWHGSDPLAVWRYGLQVAKPSLLAFRQAEGIAVELFLGFAGLMQVMGWVCIALRMALSWLNVVVSFGASLGRWIVDNAGRLTIHPRAAVGVIDLIMAAILVGLCMPVFLRQPQRDLTPLDHLLATISVLLLFLTLHAIYEAVWRLLAQPIEPQPVIED
jgi:hypothetical protein